MADRWRLRQNLGQPEDFEEVYEKMYQKVLNIMVMRCRVSFSSLSISIYIYIYIGFVLGSYISIVGSVNFVI